MSLLPIFSKFKQTLSHFSYENMQSHLWKFWIQIGYNSWISKASIKIISIRFIFISILKKWFSSVQFSHSVVSNSLRPHESQHTRPPCPSPTPGVYPNSSPSSQWCHPAIWSSVIPFSSCPQSLPASRSFPVSQLFAWGGQSIGVSASASVPEYIWETLG